MYLPVFKHVQLHINFITVKFNITITTRDIINIKLTTQHDNV